MKYRPLSCIGIALALAIVFIASTPEVFAGGHSDSDMSFWKPNLLYLHARESRRLYVEVDIVEGCQPDNGTIESLHDFLKEYCDKPDGIKIHINPPIKAKDSIVTKPEMIALGNMNGPDDQMPLSTAYLYVLFYDSTKLTSPKYKKSMNPYVRLLPYPSAIFIDINYINKANMGLLRDHQAQLLKHEAAHLLGLNWSKENSPLHCSNKKCLMYESYQIDVFKAIFQKVRPKEFCDSCKTHLNMARTSRQNTNLRFIGPLMVRSEKDYHILSLPGFIKIHFGSLGSVVWQDVLVQAQMETEARNAQPDITTVVIGSDSNTSFDRSDDTKKLFASVKNDPCRQVRNGINAIEAGLNSNDKQLTKISRTTASWLKKW
jgi:hypothetical protein